MRHAEAWERLPELVGLHSVDGAEAALRAHVDVCRACRRRLATEHPKTKLGQPEVQLGLIPGLGGTQRLPRLIGVPAALDLILTGKQVDARKAKRLGLVDDTCHPADLRTAALMLGVRRVADGYRTRGLYP